MFAYILVAHTVLCMSVCHGNGLRNTVRMRIVNPFERRQQSADDCLCMFVQRNVQLPWA